MLGKTWLRLAILIVATYVVHLPSSQGDLIWDDKYLLVENPFFRSPVLAVEAFRHHLFIDSSSGHYRPVQNLSYMVDYLVWNGNVYGYHLSNVLWHAAAGCLLFLLLRKLAVQQTATPDHRQARELASFLAALVWTLHPVHSAAVDYISGRADSLAFVFCCSAWLLYTRARSFGSRIARAAADAGAALLFLLGLCSREIALVWLVVFLFHLLFLNRSTSRRHRLAVVVVCAAMLAIYAGLRQLPGPRQYGNGLTGFSPTARAGLMLRALGDYARLAVFPTNLHMERTVVEARIFRSADWRDQFAATHLTFLGLLAAAGLIAGILKRGRGRELRMFGAVWFTAGFLPISNLFLLNATAAEHWLYLPLVGLLLVLLGWLFELQPRHFRVVAAMLMIAAVALGVRSTYRSSDWVSEQVFYERTIAAGGWSPRISLNLAALYGDRGRLDEAQHLLERTLAAWPGYPQAKSYLAVILSRKGAADADELLAAAAESSPAHKEYPRSWVASLQLARRAIARNDDEEALRVLDDARQREPNVWQLARVHAETLRRVRGPEAAHAVVEKFAADYWWHHAAHLALGKLKAQQGDAAGALNALRHASWLDIRDTEALNLMARIELRARNLPAAIKVQRRAVWRQPDEPSQHLFLAEMLKQAGRDEQAQKALDRAKALEGRISA